MRLAAMLRDYDIRSANIRFGEPIGQVKGYYRADFADAWARYCPGTGGGAVPAVPRPRPAQPRDGRNVGRLNPSQQKSRPRADLRRDGWDGWDGYPPSAASSTAVPHDRRGSVDSRSHAR